MTSEPRPVGRMIASPTPPAPPRETITAPGVLLEPLDPARHAGPTFDKVQGADWVWDYLGYGPFADADAYVGWQRSNAMGADPAFYAIIDPGRPQDGAMGLASFLRIDRNHGVIEIGHILMSPQLQRSRTASAAIMAMIGWAFAAGYRRVEWKCDSLNAPSRRAALRFGFTFEGIFRQHMIVKGRNRDTAWFAIIDSDWPPLRAACDRWLSPENFDAQGRQRESLSALTGAALPQRSDG